MSSMISLLISTCLFSPALAETPHLFSSNEYKTGKLGLFPQPNFFSHDVGSAPLLHKATWDDAVCNDTENLIFITPHGEKVVPELMILHPTQGLVWHHRIKEGPNHLHVVQYKGKDYLAYWEGSEVVGIGSGSYRLLDQHYELQYEIDAKHNLTGDLHAFSITPQGTALYTIYHPMQLKRDYPPRVKPWIYDGLIQEQNIETGEVVFEWRAMNHFAFEDMGTDTWRPDRTGFKEHPWDWFHINSIEKDPWGNYLISARYNNAITYINGKNGKIIWNLGGKRNSFTDLSGGKATDFWCQHDARWTNNYTAITIFDNSAFWGNKDNPSRALKVEIDTHRMTAKLLGEYKRPGRVNSESQGSHQILDNGNSFIGWGHTSAFTEFSPNGTMLCDTHFAPFFTKEGGKFNDIGWVQSYRAYKQKWRGYPRWNPEAKLAGDKFAISWNGATEVGKWVLSGKKPGGRFSSLGEEVKSSFETVFNVGRDWEAFKFKAVDRSGRSMGEWVTDNKGIVTNQVASGSSLHMTAPPVSPAGSAFFFFACLAALALFFTRRSPRLLSALQRYMPVRQQPPQLNGKPLA